MCVKILCVELYSSLCCAGSGSREKEVGGQRRSVACTAEVDTACEAVSEAVPTTAGCCGGFAGPRDSIHDGAFSPGDRLIKRMDPCTQAPRGGLEQDFTGQ